jgi:replication factor C small subunit
MPHLLFSGPAGVGKSTLALVIAREMFGEGWKSNFLELNASDERGIDVVRTKVKDFARTKAFGNVPFKIIFLDECDALTKEAQQALRRTMEQFSGTCRFVLSCNYSSKIIDPIQSRCSVFRFKPLAKKDIFALIDDIAKQEKLKVDDDAKEALYDVSGGDCRRLENIMQSSVAVSNHITYDLIYEVASAAKPKEIDQILQFCIKGEFAAARKTLLKTMLEHGLSGFDILKQIQGRVWMLDLDAEVRLQMITLCGDYEFRLVEGSDEYLQLESLLAAFIVLLTHKR